MTGLVLPESPEAALASGVIAFILQTGKFPAGDKPFDAAAHGGVQYRTYKP